MPGDSTGANGSEAQEESLELSKIVSHFRLHPDSAGGLAFPPVIL